MRPKYRIRFAKAGDLRFLSHHDLMRVFERLLRRAGIPYASTEGFHPKPRMAFASALGINLVGRDEVVELELERLWPAEELASHLAAQAPPGLEIHSVRLVEARQTAHPVRATYRVPLRPEDQTGLAERIDQLLESNQICVERTKPRPRRVDIRPFVERIEIKPDGLDVTVAITPHGSARMNEILTLVGLDHLPEQGVILERLTLEIEDETSAFPQRPAAAAPVGAMDAETAV